MKNRVYKNYIFILILLFVSSCADKESITYQGLFDSIKDNKVLVVKAILEKNKLDINYVDEYVVTTALNEAVFHGNREVVDLVLSYGADVNIKSHSGKTALMVAAGNNSVDNMMLLLANGADIDAIDNRNYNALMYAAESGSYYACEFLFGMGINANVISIDEKSALDIARENSYTPIVSLLTKTYSPLIEAVVASNNRLVLQMIATNANLNVVDANGLTALHYATEKGNIEIVRSLLSKDSIDINKKDKSGATALSLAVELNDINITELLLQKNAGTDVGSMPIIFKAKTPRMLRLLVKHGLNINEVYGDFAYTPLMIAAEKDTVDMVKTFIELGADQYARNKEGLNSLKLAERAGNINVVKYLSSIQTQIR